MNGTLIDETEAKLSVYDSALMFGDMVFEMTRSFNKKHFKLEEHVDRLFLGLKILRINLDVTKKQLIDICTKTASINENLFTKDDEHRLMIATTGRAHPNVTFRDTFQSLRGQRRKANFELPVDR